MGSLPAVKSAWDSGKLSTDPMLKVFGTQLADAKSAPAIATWEQVADTLDHGIEEAVIGGQSSDAALKAAASKANTIGTG